jgi:hypothetical protein
MRGRGFRSCGDGVKGSEGEVIIGLGGGDSRTHIDPLRIRF